MNIKLSQVELKGNRLLVLRDKKEDSISPSGLVVKAEHVQERPQTGMIVAVGDLVTAYTKGQRVLFSPFVNESIEIDFKGHILLSEPEPIMIIN